MAGILEDDSNSVFLATLAGDASPSAVLAFKQSAEPQTVELAKLFVVPSAQSSGLAKSFHELGETFVIEQGYREIELWTWEISLQSRRFYERSALVHHHSGEEVIHPGVRSEDDITIRYVKQIG